MPEARLHALSFDIEDWFHIVDIRSTEDPKGWAGLPSIVESETNRILDTLAEHDVQATFFFLGWIAERYPRLVCRAAREGHEIGSHSFWHRRVYELSPEAFSEDLVRSVNVLQQQAGVRVLGYRAPSFSIIPGCEWAFDAIADAGLMYDASLFPASRAHGGYPCATRPHRRIIHNGRELPELPASVMHVGPLRLCYSGGGYFRLWPQWFIERAFDRNARADRPTVVYLHPRDFAVHCPRAAMPLHRRFKCYVGQRSTEPKLRALLERYRFTSCANLLRQRGLLPVETSSPRAAKG